MTCCLIPIFLSVLYIVSDNRLGYGQKTMEASYRIHRNRYYAGASLGSNSIMSHSECGMWCVSVWVCTGYWIRWVSRTSGYCTITREDNPVANLVEESGYSFYAPYNTTCKASSNLNNDLVLHGCEKVMDGRTCDSDQCNWISAGEGVDSWIQLNFNRFWNMIRVDVHSRNSPRDQCSELALEFTNDPSVQVGEVSILAFRN
ncbi:hypothetical protein LSH36_1475g00017 [Paralvinella palmiformis]|uniref:DUF7402 domain-containing protein n=1 Tax=Paralvinella palmiformis TaxID=53620 RepID=A0AAD9ISF4_9ANNE|nr:hypothetical protein LSH36_1475g00017 [Paralvinella palmiformis]